MEKEYYFDTHISAPFNFQSFGNGFQNPNFENPIAQCSSLSTMVSSPSTYNSATENFAVRELIRKLGNAGDNSPEFIQRSSYMNSPNTSCYNTPINSPPELQVPIINHFVKENIPILRNPTPMNPVLAERAAKFSGFNGRRSPIGINNAEFHSQLLGNGKFPRVSSSPSLNINRSSLANKNSIKNQMNLRSDNAELSVSEQKSIQEIGFPAPNELNSKKRKGFPRGEAKVAESNEHLDIKKRLKMTSGNENGGVKSEEENNAGGEEVKKQANKNQKPTEPPKDYIHVRARRGEATDSHSLAERVRREKIGEKMKLLQDLVPGCSKVTGKALMLDEIINYVQSLQRQSEFLSMKLSTFNSSENVNMDNLVSNDVFQPNGSFSDNIYPVESSASANYGQQTPDVRNKQVEPLDETLCCNFSLQSSQFPAFSEDDLRSIVQTGFAPN